MSGTFNAVTITGCGILSPAGTGKKQFFAALQTGASNFSTVTFENGEEHCAYPAGLINDFQFRESVESLELDEKIIREAKRIRNISMSASYGMYCALEAWADAELVAGETDMERVAVIAAGTNTQHSMLTAVREQYRDKLHFINPNYGLNFFDTDIVGVLSELLGINGEGFAAGAASASGNMAIIQGFRLVTGGEYDAVLVIAPMMELSKYEYQALTSLGAMCRISADTDVSSLCRPFDEAHSGFVYSQSAGCIVLESAAHAAARKKIPYACVTGYGIHLDSNRNPNPSKKGELRAIEKALEKSGLQPHQVDYVNTHGTGSVIGDDTEVEALLAAGLNGAMINSTKSVIGHGLSAAGLCECIATILQMKNNFLHPSLNLVNPISQGLNWIQEYRPQTIIRRAISNNFGFGGVNTSIVIENNL